MRILFVIDHLRGGGTEQQFVHIVNNINIDVDKYVYFTEDKGIRLKDLNRNIKSSGGYSKRTPFATIIELRNIIKSYKPDIVHAFLMYSSFITAICKLITNHNFILVATEFCFPEEILKEVKFGGFKRALLKLSYRFSDKITTGSKAVKKAFEREGYVTVNNKIRYIYDGISLDKYFALEEKDILRKRFNFPDDDFVICFCGSLIRRKGVEYLIKAFKLINMPRIKLVLLGNGPHEDMFMNMAADDKRISFIGYKINAVEYIKASNLFVLPSVYEGLPNVILEAMAVSTPVIATDVWGIPELIEDETNGLLVPPKNVSELKAAIAELINNPEKAKEMAKVALEKVKYFNLKRMVNEYEMFYRELLQHKRDNA